MSNGVDPEQDRRSVSPDLSPIRLIYQQMIKMATSMETVKGICPIEIIKGLTDKGQFQYLTKLKETYLYTTQFLSLRDRSIKFYQKIPNPFMGPLYCPM